MADYDEADSRERVDEYREGQLLLPTMSAFHFAA